MTDRVPPDSGTAGLLEPVSELEPAEPRAGEQAPSADPLARKPVVGSSQPGAVSTLDEQPVFGAGTLGGRTGPGRKGDRVLAGLSSGAGAFVVLLIGLVTAFLVIRALPAITEDKSNFLTS
ncbi:MAG: hypothetical protein ABI047_10490, partial [Jatrophihabitantaceae bacterium]